MIDRHTDLRHVADLKSDGREGLLATVKVVVKVVKYC